MCHQADSSRAPAGPLLQPFESLGGWCMIDSNLQNSMLSVAEPERLAESPAGAVATARACGILIVDDQAHVRDVLSIGLRQEGFAVWLAANGREAFDLYRCRRADIDVVLLDMHMPVLNGPQT